MQDHNEIPVNLEYARDEYETLRRDILKIEADLGARGKSDTAWYHKASTAKINKLARKRFLKKWIHERTQADKSDLIERDSRIRAERLKLAMAQRKIASERDLLSLSYSLLRELWNEGILDDKEESLIILMRDYLKETSKE